MCLWFSDFQAMYVPALLHSSVSASLLMITCLRGKFFHLVTWQATKNVNWNVSWVRCATAIILGPRPLPCITSVKYCIGDKGEAKWEKRDGNFELERFVYLFCFFFLFYFYFYYYFFFLRFHIQVMRHSLSSHLIPQTSKPFRIINSRMVNFFIRWKCRRREIIFVFV